MEEEPVAAEPAAEEPAAPAAAEEPAVEAPPEPDAQPEEPPGDAEGIPPEQEQPQDEIAQEEEPPPAEEQDDAEAVMQVNDPGEQEPQAGVDAATQDYGARSDAAEAASISDAEAREVTFVIQPEGYRHSELIYMNAPVAQVAELLESRLGIPAYALRFTLEDGSQLQRNQTLGSVAPTAGPQITVFVVVERDEPAPREPSGLMVGSGGELYLNVNLGNGDSVMVELVQFKGRKPYLGGYRHKKTGVEYHHASTQSERAAPKPKPLRFVRDTQTVSTKTVSAWTAREAATQVARPGLFLDNDKDREIIAGPYTPSEVHHQRRVDATVVLQRYARGWAARKVAAKLAYSRDERELFEAAAEDRDADVLLRTQQRELQRRLRPRTKKDFAKLHKELEIWHGAESAKIAAAQMDPAAAAAARIALLNKETRLLGTLERLRTAAANEARDEALDRMLDSLAAPKVWAVGGDSKVEVFTPETARALELISLHKALHGPVVDTDARLETLRALQRQAAAYDCMLTRDLLDLSEREIDLLRRGRPPESMAQLRKRIRNLFLQFIETPEFNPAAATLAVAPAGFC